MRTSGMYHLYCQPNAFWIVGLLLVQYLRYTEAQNVFQVVLLNNSEFQHLKISFSPIREMTGAAGFPHMAEESVNQSQRQKTFQ